MKYICLQSHGSPSLLSNDVVMHRKSNSSFGSSTIASSTSAQNEVLSYPRQFSCQVCQSSPLYHRAEIESNSIESFHLNCYVAIRNRRCEILRRQWLPHSDGLSTVVDLGRKQLHSISGKGGKGSKGTKKRKRSINHVPIVELKELQMLLEDAARLDSACQIGKKRQKQTDLITLIIALDKCFFRLLYQKRAYPELELHIPSAWDYFEETCAAQLEVCTKMLPLNARMEAAKELPQFFENVWDLNEENTCGLLRYLQARWFETCVLFSSFPHMRTIEMFDTPREFHRGEEMTMKGVYPLSFPLLSTWRSSVRDNVCHIYSFAVPNENALREMESVVGEKDLIELGGGTGYWMSLLEKRGNIDVSRMQCFDICPPGQGMNDYHGAASTFTRVSSGTVADICAKKANSKNQVLFICYPPPEPTHMLADALPYFRGSYVLFVGEWCGDTQSEDAQEILSAEFFVKRRVHLPNFGNTAYQLIVFERIGKNIGKEGKSETMSSHSTPPTLSETIPIDVCAVCGNNSQKLLRRCAYTWAICFCSEKCQTGQLGLSLHAVVLAARCIAWSPEKLQFSNSTHFV